MKYFYLILISSFSYLSLADSENSVLVKGGNVFLPDQGFVKKDLFIEEGKIVSIEDQIDCLLYTSPSPRDKRQSRMPSSA